MKSKLILLTLLLGLLSLGGGFASPKVSDARELTAHEWGTFTSVAGEKGEAIAWRTFADTSDLPCFVDRFDGFKGGLFTTVRMETPVIYFYGTSAASVDVKVGFPKGTITEWYPKAVTPRSFDSLQWNNVAITPGVAENYPVAGRSHYVSARATDAVPLKVGAQQEKFLFYRGAGTFPLPLTATIGAKGEIVVKNIGADPIPSVILFENRGGNRRFRLIGALQHEASIDLQSLQNDWSGLLVQLERILVDEGLYPKEAHAMVETWRDSWFEEGTRLFYIVPRQVIDSVLPLEIKPAPAQIDRVFVGRMEIITPAIQDTVRNAIAKQDRETLARYGRFLEPIAKRIGAANEPFVKSVYNTYLSSGLSCVQ
jgi:hypothetical protein